MARLLGFVLLLPFAAAVNVTRTRSLARDIASCPGDTRGDGRCNKDDTHRVCAKIGVEGTSFWEFTGQSSWCNTDIYGDGLILRGKSKWATASWIKGEGCNDKVNFDCAATDVCNLKASYTDGNVDLKPAHDCMQTKCKQQWDACWKPREIASQVQQTLMHWMGDLKKTIQPTVFFAWRRLVEARRQEKRAADLRREHARLAKDEAKKRMIQATLALTGDPDKMDPTALKVVLRAWRECMLESRSENALKFERARATEREKDRKVQAQRLATKMRAFAVLALAMLAGASPLLRPLSPTAPEATLPSALCSPCVQLGSQGINLHLARG
eukprot:s428_g9.t2